MLPRHSSVNSEVNQLLQIPNFDALPMRRANGQSINSSLRRVQSGRVKNDLKSSQHAKMSLIPRPSFLTSRKSVHGSRSTQLNARKELIKKMVFLAECNLKDSKEKKKSTPVKVLAGLTPKKTPRSQGYFILPEFRKKVQKVEDIRSPIQDFIKKEVFAYSVKPTPLFKNKNEISPTSATEQINSSLMVKPIQEMEVKKSSDKNNTFVEILSYFKAFNEEIRMIHKKIKLQDNSFENKLKELPDYRIYNEFCFFQTKNEQLYKEMQALEMDLREFISSHTKPGSKLKAYMEKKQEIFERQTHLHKDFEEAVNSMVEKFGNVNSENIIGKSTPKVEKPKLRRSLRLSKITESKFEERTPLTKKLKKLDSKSKVIQKSRKIP